MPDGRRTLIVGGGIAGLALARMLVRGGVSPEVIEREPVWRPAGTGMYLPGDAVRALGGLGLEAPVAYRAVEIPMQRFCDHRGRLLCEVDVAKMWAAVGRCLAVRRADLHEVLREGASGVPVRLGLGWRERPPTSTSPSPPTTPTWSGSTARWRAWAGSGTVGAFGTVFATRYGRLELVRRAHAVGHYADWLRGAREHRLDARLTVVVAAPEDILRSKEAAGRERTVPRCRRCARSSTNSSGFSCRRKFDGMQTCPGYVPNFFRVSADCGAVWRRRGRGAYALCGLTPRPAARRARRCRCRSSGRLR